PSLAVDECVEVDTGDTFTVAISASGVTDLMAWDIYYAYDSTILEVVGRDVHYLLEEEPNSNVFDLSDPVPNTNGLYRVGAADTGGAGTGEDGAGVLAVLTLRARGEGVSWSALVRYDTDGDGSYDYGPTLTETGGGHIGDNNGDGVFDGVLRRGQISVGDSCRAQAPTPYIDPDVIPVQATVNTPSVSNPAESTPPGGTPGAGNDTPTASGSAADTPRRTPTAEVRPGARTDGGSGGVSPLLATAIGAGGGAAIVASYLFFRVVRRPA
ncbi:MAG TPA: cohesin domain-containing protein, partial [Dehalococcoidia bacterium]|nr:cohesin domain-containing protein [Dehalococcoidia bacterium]